MEKEKIIEELTSHCKTDMYGIINLINRYGFQFVRSTTFKSFPRLAVFYQNGIKNKIITMPAYLPYDHAIWILKYMMVYYLTSDDKDIYITFDDAYNYDEEVINIVEEIDKGLKDGVKRNK